MKNCELIILTSLVVLVLKYFYSNYDLKNIMQLYEHLIQLLLNSQFNSFEAKFNDIRMTLRSRSWNLVRASKRVHENPHFSRHDYQSMSITEAGYKPVCVIPSSHRCYIFVAMTMNLS